MCVSVLQYPRWNSNPKQSKEKKAYKFIKLRIRKQATLVVGKKYGRINEKKLQAEGKQRLCMQDHWIDSKAISQEEKERNLLWLCV